MIPFLSVAHIRRCFRQAGAATTGRDSRSVIGSLSRSTRSKNGIAQLNDRRHPLKVRDLIHPYFRDVLKPGKFRQVVSEIITRTCLLADCVDRTYLVGKARGIN